jgi:hypothetical protein
VKISVPPGGVFWDVLANNAQIWAPKVWWQVLGWLGTTLGLQLICDHGYGHDKIEIHFLPTEDEVKRK